MQIVCSVLIGSIAMSAETFERLLDQLDRNLLVERAAYIDLTSGKSAKKYRLSQEALLKSIRTIGKTGDISLILSAEREILANEKRFYANSPAMGSSLDNAVSELDQAGKMLPLVLDPVLYAAVDASHGNPKSRIGSLPRDAARHFFASHNARLLNTDKSRLTDTEKQTVDARRHNIRIASLVYTSLQEKALGIDLIRKQDRSMAL